jgi:hypothetical protein
VDEISTFWGELYVPASGEKVGVAALEVAAGKEFEYSISSI